MTRKELIQKLRLRLQKSLVPIMNSHSESGLSLSEKPQLPRSRKLNKVAPPGFSEKRMLELKAQYPGKPEKAFATAWKIHNQSKKAEPTVLKPPGASRSPASIRGASPDQVKVPSNPVNVAVRSKLGKEEIK